MNTVAPQRVPASTNHLSVVRQPRDHWCVADIRPGQLFLEAGDTDAVYALLSHAQIGVEDVERIWCVVVATNTTVTAAGALVALPRDTPVERVQVETMRLRVDA